MNTTEEFAALCRGTAPDAGLQFPAPLYIRAADAACRKLTEKDGIFGLSLVPSAVIDGIVGGVIGLFAGIKIVGAAAFVAWAAKAGALGVAMTFGIPIGLACLGVTAAVIGTIMVMKAIEKSETDYNIAADQNASAAASAMAGLGASVADQKANQYQACMDAWNDAAKCQEQVYGTSDGGTGNGSGSGSGAGTGSGSDNRGGGSGGTKGKGTSVSGSGASVPVTAAKDPSVGEVAKKAQTAAKDNAGDAMSQYNKILASIMPDSNDLANWQQQNLNSIQNPFTKTDTTGKETSNSTATEKTITEEKAALSFGSDDFSGVEAYAISVGDMRSYLSVVSDINVITDISEYQTYGLNSFSGTKYTVNGQTHYVARAYDADGKALDAVVESEQKAYLAFGGKSGSNGYAKLHGTGNSSNYNVDGYGAITFGGTEKNSMYISGGYDSGNGTTLTVSEVTGAAVPDTYKGTIKSAIETMRAVNLKSYKTDEPDSGKVTFAFTDAKTSASATVTENGHTYTYNSGDKITVTDTGTDVSGVSDVSSGTITKASVSKEITVGEAIKSGMYTMADLIKAGYEPSKIDGTKYTKDAETAAKAADATFTVSLTGTAKYTDYRMVFYTKGTEVWATYGNYSEIVQVTDSKGTKYSAKSAIDGGVCTADVLLKKLQTQYGVKYEQLSKASASAASD